MQGCGQDGHIREEKTGEGGEERVREERRENRDNEEKAEAETKVN